MINNILIKSIGILLALTICFGYIVNNLYFLFGIIFIILTISYILSKRNEIKISTQEILWLLYGLIIFLSCIYSSNQSLAFKYSIVFTILIIIVILLNNTKDWNDVFLQSLLLFSSVHVAATIINSFNQEFIKQIISKILTPSRYSMNLHLMENVGNPGITYQTGINAFFITLFICLIFSSAISNKKNKTIKIFLLILGYVALFLTNKRGLIIANLVSTLFIVIYDVNLDIKKFIKYILLILIIITIFLLIGRNIPDAFNVIERVSNVGLNSSSRDIIYKQMKELIFKSPVTFLSGYGTLSADKILGIGGHNIYLNILLESGIIALLIFMFAVSVNLLKTFKLLKILIKLQNDKNIQKMKYLLVISIYIQIFILVYGFSGNPIYDLEELAMYLITIAITCVAKNKYKEVYGQTKNNGKGEKYDRNTNIS